MKVLTFTTLYPDSTRPEHGIFVENRLRQLVGRDEVESRVVAPVPWFPGTGSSFGGYARYARVPAGEVWHGIEVIHPRYPLIPKIGMTIAPGLLALGAARALRGLYAAGYRFDIIDAHYFYPDGVAAVMLGRTFRKPVVITARGSDLNLISRYYWARRWIRWAASEAAALIAVSRALQDVLLRLGVPEDKVTVLRNGVDLSLFKPPENREALRRSLGLNGCTLVAVGKLIPLKGHELMIQSLTGLPGVVLLIIGEGPERERLAARARSLGMAGRVRFLGRIEHDRLADYYGAADALLLASSREGWPNVLLEAMACGTPVISTRVGGCPEVVAASEAGLLVEERTPDALALAVERLMGNYPDRAATRRYAERFSWDETTLGQMRIFKNALLEASSS